MASTQEQLQQVVEGVSDAEARALTLEALRRWYQKATRHEFEVFGDLAADLVPELAKRKGLPFGGRPAETFAYCLRYPFMGAFLDALWWLVRSGLTIPLGVGNADLPHRFLLTRAGIRFLESTGADHPLSAGFVARVRARCPGISDDVTDLLDDAHECFQRGLLRPAAMLTGVAFESAVEAIAESLVVAGLLVAVPAKAWRRIVEVDAVVDRKLADLDDRRAAHDACTFAHELRRRRNDGSHAGPRWRFDDREEIEEMLSAAGRYLPRLWALH